MKRNFGFHAPAPSPRSDMIGGLVGFAILGATIVFALFLRMHGNV